jgi:hypothetical protein
MMMTIMVIILLFCVIEKNIIFMLIIWIVGNLFGGKKSVKKPTVDINL